MLIPAPRNWFSWRGNGILTRKVSVLEVVNQREENSTFPKHTHSSRAEGQASSCLERLHHFVTFLAEGEGHGI